VNSKAPAFEREQKQVAKQIAGSPVIPEHLNEITAPAHVIEDNTAITLNLAVSRSPNETSSTFAGITRL
jgi:hypothetical protein